MEGGMEQWRPISTRACPTAASATALCAAIAVPCVQLAALRAVEQLNASASGRPPANCCCSPASSRIRSYNRPKLKPQQQAQFTFRSKTRAARVRPARANSCRACACYYSSRLSGSPSLAGGGAPCWNACGASAPWDAGGASAPFLLARTCSCSCLHSPSSAVCLTRSRCTSAGSTAARASCCSSRSTCAAGERARVRVQQCHRGQTGSCSYHEALAQHAAPAPPPNLRLPAPAAPAAPPSPRCTWPSTPRAPWPASCAAARSSPSPSCSSQTAARTRAQHSTRARVHTCTSARV